MKRVILVLVVLLFFVSVSFAQPIPNWKNNRDNPSLICSVRYDGFQYGDCSQDPAGRGFLNIALWFGQGECLNPTLGGSRGNPGATQIISIWNDRDTQHARVIAPPYIPEGEGSQWCGPDETPGTSVGSDGDIIEYTAEFSRSGQVNVNWTVSPNRDFPACMWVEVTSYNPGSLNIPMVWEDDHFRETGYSMVEDWRLGYSTGASVAFWNGNNGVSIRGSGTHHYDLFYFPTMNVSKVSAVYEFCGVVAGQDYSGQSTITIGGF